MPILNGRYYMNPQYGAALESARAADAEQGEQQPSWLDRFLGLVPTDEDPERMSRRVYHPSDISGESSEIAEADELEAQNQRNGEAQQNHTEDANKPIPQIIAATAGKYDGSTDWAFAVRKGAFAPNTNKCNQFVGDVVKEAGAPASVIGSDGKARYPLAAEWADPNTKIPNWRVLGPHETPQPGDVAAYKLPGGGTRFSGHSGIVTSVDRDGTVHGAAAHEKVVGPDDKFNPGVGAAIITYRRFTGGEQ